MQEWKNAKRSKDQPNFPKKKWKRYLPQTRYSNNSELKLNRSEPPYVESLKLWEEYQKGTLSNEELQKKLKELSSPTTNQILFTIPTIGKTIEEQNESILDDALDKFGGSIQ